MTYSCMHIILYNVLSLLLNCHYALYAYLQLQQRGSTEARIARIGRIGRIRYLSFWLILINDSGRPPLDGIGRGLASFGLVKLSPI